MEIDCFLLKDFIFFFLFAYVTAKFALRDYKHKKVFDRQKELYLKFLNILFLLKREPYQQFSDKMLSVLENMQSEFSIYASKKCRKDYYNFLDRIQKLHDDYLKNKDPNEDEIIDGDLISDISFQESYNYFKEKNQIGICEFNKLSEKAINHIQKSLKIR